MTNPKPLPDEAVREEDITGEPQGPAPSQARDGDIIRGDPAVKGGGPGGEDELAGADALGGSDADIGRGAD